MYGITDEDIKFIDDKIDFQKKFLENFSVDFGDKSINMLDNTYSANLNPKKYFSEINNRVNTMVENAKEKGLKPVFVTLTAPSQYFSDSSVLGTNKKALDYRYTWYKEKGGAVGYGLKKINFLNR